MKPQRRLIILATLVLLLGVTAIAYAQTTISPGDSIQGELNNNTAQYSFTAKAGETVIISLNSNSDELDPLIELHDASGAEVGRDDDSGGFLNARLAFTAAQDGTYTIVVTSYLGAGTGAYTLSLDTQTATAITVGTPVETTMEGAAPLYFSFSGTEGDVLDIYAVSDAGEDTRLVLRGPDNEEIASDDDSGADTNPYIQRVALLSTGTYQLELSPFSDSPLSGNITLTVEKTQLLTLDANPQTVTLGGDNPDSEVFQFDATAGTTYRLIVALDASSTSGASIEIFEGEAFSTTSLNAYGSTSRLTMDFEATITGSVIVKVTGGAFFSQGATEVTVSVETVE